jgi:hypothetical protein
MGFDRRRCANRTLSVAGALIMGSAASAAAPGDPGFEATFSDSKLDAV